MSVRTSQINCLLYIFELGNNWFHEILNLLKKISFIMSSWHKIFKDGFMYLNYYLYNILRAGRLTPYYIYFNSYTISNNHNSWNNIYTSVIINYPDIWYYKKQYRQLYVLFCLFSVQYFLVPYPSEKDLNI